MSSNLVKLSCDWLFCRALHFLSAPRGAAVARRQHVAGEPQAMTLRVIMRRK